MEQDVNRYHVGVRQRVPFRRGAAAYAGASYRSAKAENSIFMLLEAVLVISDGLEAALSSAADALIHKRCFCNSDM